MVELENNTAEPSPAVYPMKILILIYII